MNFGHTPSKSTGIKHSSITITSRTVKFWKAKENQEGSMNSIILKNHIPIVGKLFMHVETLSSSMRSI